MDKTMTREAILATLEDLLGQPVIYMGKPCRLVELLDEGPTLVLGSLEGNNIQADQYGNPRRRVPHTYCIPVFEDDGVTPHPELLALDLPLP